jgi:TRAP-type C4-dicarboxylate transport system substrate-binding protein
MQQEGRSIIRRCARHRVALAALLALPAHAVDVVQSPETEQPRPSVRLRIVGGLANVHQYTRNEKPFWTQALPARTGGRVTAEIVPFDQAGIRGQEVLRLMQIGVVPFGTALLGVSSANDPDWGAPDLAGLNPDIASIRRSIQAFRPHLAQSMKERYGIELLAVYLYPAQVLYCKQAFRGLHDLDGRRIRIATPSQVDFVEALGATYVRIPFAEVVQHIGTGNIDCAITGTMSGNTIGLHETTSYLHSLPVSWGLSVFGANAAAWKGLPPDVRKVLSEELPKLEADIWAEAERETAEGVACNTGGTGCANGRLGKMVEVRATKRDDEKRQQVLRTAVLPRWIQRCGLRCTNVWNQTLKAVTGIEAPTP